MCGIAGILAQSSGVIDLDALRRASDWMACRGPDGEGIWLSEDRRLALAHRRLSIIDLSERAAQPMVSADNRFVISFNGEIYNYRQLRRELESHGSHFRSESDTEVLLQLYAAKGSGMLRELRGMFAFAIWDDLRRELFLARDPFGIKPLYYSTSATDFRFASEVKALAASGGLDLSPQAAGHVGFFLWGSVPEPFTLYNGIQALPAGTSMYVSAAGPTTPVSYSDVATWFREVETERRHALNVEERHEVLRAAVVDTVRHHLVSDVPVGLFLSAGVDSGVLAALARDEIRSLRTVTLGFEEFKGTADDETVIAARLAKQLGTDHQTVWITRADFLREIPNLLRRMDQPSIDGVNSYFVAHAASLAGIKVALSGLGGDELFGGYPGFHQIPNLVRYARRAPGGAMIGKMLRHALADVSGKFISPKYAGLLEYGRSVSDAYLLRRSLMAPWELHHVLGRDFAEEGWRQLDTRMELRRSVDGLESSRLQISALEARWYLRNQLLRDTDWASMSHHVEVRVPFVDSFFWQSVAPLAAAGHLSKQDLAKMPRIPLPTEIMDRPKTGFSIPTARWLHSSLLPNVGMRGLRQWASYVYASHVTS